MTIQTSRVANPELLVLLVLRDDAADAVDEHHLVVRDESHELVFAVAIEQHQYPYLVLAHLRCRNVHTAALQCKVSSLTTLCIIYTCLLYTSPSPRDGLLSRMPSSA